MPASYAGAGVPLGGAGARPDAADGPILAATGNSSAFGFDIEIASPREMLPAEHAGLRWVGILVSAALVIAVGAFLLLLPKRRANDPVSQLAEALKAGEFVPYYQPVVDIRSGQLRGAEVLVRWRKPDGSLVLPGSFIPLAESSGLIQRDDAPTDARSLRRGRPRDRPPAGAEDLVQFRRQAVRRRGHRQGRAQDLRRIADQAVRRSCSKSPSAIRSRT